MIWGRYSVDKKETRGSRKTFFDEEVSDDRAKCIHVFDLRDLTDILSFYSRAIKVRGKCSSQYKFNLEAGAPCRKRNILEAFCTFLIR